MVDRRLVRFAVFLIILSAVSHRLSAQGSKADYERAKALPAQRSGKVLNARLDVNWSADGRRFSYRREKKDGAFEFIAVDTETKTRTPLFDAVPVAAALAKLSGQPVDPERPPIDRIVESDGTVLALISLSPWAVSIDPKTSAVKALVEDAAAPLSTPAAERAGRSRNGRRSTWLYFTNAADQPVRIFWVDSGGKKKDFGLIAPGETRRQQTFGGHAWSFEDEAKKALGGIVAPDLPTIVRITRPAAAAESRPAASRPAKNEDPKEKPGKLEVFVRDRNVFWRDPRTGTEGALTTNGTEKDGFEGTVRKTPDGRRAIVYRRVQGEDHLVYYVESSPSDQLQPKLHTLHYQKPGDRLDVRKPHLFDLEKKKEIPLSDELFPNPWSIGDDDFSADGRTYSFVYNERGHRVVRLIAMDTENGNVRAIVREEPDTFVDYPNSLWLHRLEKTGEILWMSERDGWRHLYLIDAKTGRVKNQVTKGEWVVRGVEFVDEEKREVLYRAGGIRPGEDPYHVHYARSKFDGSAPRILTEGDGTHEIEWSPDHRFFLDRWSRVDLAPKTDLRRADEGSLVVNVESADISALEESGWRPIERFTAKGRDGTTDIWGVIVRPSNFDPKKRYPVIENIYAGPHGFFVPKEFRPSFAYEEIAELGFIVVQIDGMGTAHRSKAFHDVAWKNLVDAGFPDRILWMKAAAARHPEMDLSRVGIWGGSAGGQNALGALLTHGDFYKVAVADCGCHDNRMDKVWWNELWMSWPVGPHYAEQSNVTLAKNLTGKLLLVVGEKDENVDPATTMQVVNALIKADKDFDLLVIPGAGHGAAETPYGKRRRQDFFVRHLLGKEPRWE